MSERTHAGSSPLHGPLPRIAWTVAVLLATAVLVLDRTSYLPPGDAVPWASVLITGCFASALANRIGGYPLVALVLGLLLPAAAVLSREQVLLAGVAVGTAVLSGVLAVMETQPASGLLATVREVLVATALAVIGALAVAGYRAEVDAMRFRYLALAAGLLVALALVNVLGAGLHGLGRRGLLMLVGGVVLLVAAVAYGEALSRWGTPELVHAIESLRNGLRSRLYAVPHPIETLLGYPALTWGVFMRARRRQGWWVSAFGVVATLSTACALVDPSIALLRAALGAGYSLVLGVLLGCLVIRLDQFLTGPRGARARRDEEAQAHRPEPGRSRSLR